MKLTLSYICANTLIYDTVKTLKDRYNVGIHIDLMDGHFVPRLGVHPELINDLKKECNVPVDAHCMLTANNHAWKDVLNSKADVIYAHYEAFHSKEHTLKFLKQDSRLQLAFKPQWTIQQINEICEEMGVNDYLLMAYNPGITKQNSFYDLKKIMNTQRYVTVDGGIDFDTVEQFLGHNKVSLVAGSKLLFNSKYKQNIERLLC